MMSISERERHALDSIESGLAHTAPGLASMLVMFSRLTADEPMPVRKPVRYRGKPRGPATMARRAGPRRVWLCRIGRMARGWLWLAAAAALLVVAMTLTHGTRVSACTHPLTTACERGPAGFPARAGENGR